MTAIQLAEDKAELVKRETGIVALERRVKRQKEELKSKAKKNIKKETVMEAKQVAAQLRLMAGQLDRLADQILDHTNTSM